MAAGNGRDGEKTRLETGEGAMETDGEALQAGNGLQ